MCQNKNNFLQSIRAPKRILIVIGIKDKKNKRIKLGLNKKILNNSWLKWMNKH